jgi:hypothetical protein
MRGHAATLSVLLVTLVALAAPALAGREDGIRSDVDWILGAQMADGAIAHQHDRVTVLPYLANFAAIGLARARKVTGDRRYGEAWYQHHEDANGYVTDYVVRNGTLHSTGDMDSTDAYAGTFLIAVRDAWRATKSRSHLRSVRPGVVGAVHAIESTQDGDGLTWAKPSWHVKYLMDQAETYAGLVSAVEIGRAVGERSLARRAARDAARLRVGADKLWNRATGAYDWALHQNTARRATDWSVLYPDAAAQAWVAALGLARGARAKALTARFERAQPQWADPSALARFDSGHRPIGYWAVAGWAVARVDAERASVAAAAIRSQALASNRRWPFTPADAGQLIVLGSGGYSR